MLAMMRLLATRICLVLLAAGLVLLWVPAVLWAVVGALLSELPVGPVVAWYWLQARLDAILFWEVFKNPIENDEDEANGV